MRQEAQEKRPTGDRCAALWSMSVYAWCSNTQLCRNCRDSHASARLPWHHIPASDAARPAITPGVHIQYRTPSRKSANAVTSRTSVLAPTVSHHRRQTPDKCQFDADSDMWDCERRRRNTSFAVGAKGFHRSKDCCVVTSPSELEIPLYYSDKWLSSVLRTTVRGQTKYTVGRS